MPPEGLLAPTGLAPAGRKPTDRASTGAVAAVVIVPRATVGAWGALRHRAAEGGGGKGGGGSSGGLGGGAAPEAGPVKVAVGLLAGREEGALGVHHDGPGVGGQEGGLVVRVLAEVEHRAGVAHLVRGPGQRRAVPGLGR